MLRLGRHLLQRNVSVYQSLTQHLQGLGWRMERLVMEKAAEIDENKMGRNDSVRLGMPLIGKAECFNSLL